MSQDKERTTSPSRPEGSGSGSRANSSPSLSYLVNRLDSISKQERQIISDHYRKSLHELGSDLSSLTQNELSIIRSDLEKIMKRSWWKTVLMSAAIFLGFLIGIWAWAEWQIQRYGWATEGLEEAQNKLALIEAKLSAERRELKGVTWTRDTKRGILWVKTTGRLGETDQGQWAEVIVED